MEDIGPLALAVMAAGLAIAAWAARPGSPVRAADGPLGVPPDRPLPDTRLALLGAVVLWIGAGILLSQLLRGADAPQRVLVGQGAHGLIALAVLRSALAGPRPALGAGRRLAVGLLAGVAAYGVVALLSIGLLAAYRAAGSEPPGQDVVEILRATHGGTRWLLIAAAALVAPCAEETFYRGILLPVLARAMPVEKALLAQAAVFGFVHFVFVPAAWPLAVPIALVGWVTGWLYVRTHSLLVAVLAHATFNALQIGLLFAAGG